ncbi:MAG TPA: TetR/AcrR family transcriptional regulator [Acidimicrobiales bacterium]
MGLRQEHKDRLRQEIRETSLRLFHERGFDETRVQDIIQLVGISEKTFFNYFPSKLAVLDTSATELVAAYHVLLEFELADTERPVVERLMEVIELWALAFSGDREFLATVVDRTPAFFGAAGPIQEQQKTTYRLLTALLQQGQEAGELRSDDDPHQLAEVLTAVMLLTTLNWLGRYWDLPDEPLQDRLVRAVDIVLKGAATSGGEG